MNLRVMVQPSSDEQTQLHYSVSKGLVYDGVRQLDGLPVNHGSTMVLIQSSHDSCVLKVVDTPDSKGVDAEAQSNPHGFPSMSSSQFIRAQ